MTPFIIGAFVGGAVTFLVMCCCSVGGGSDNDIT